MLFNSIEFVIFLGLVYLAFRLLPHRLRHWLLLAASYFFYGSWNAKLLYLIIATSLVTWLAGKAIAGYEDWRRQLGLLVGVGAPLLVLFYFKYFNFFLRTLHRLQGLFGSTKPFDALAILLPVGISFYTFQALAYVIDVYRGRQEAEAAFSYYALYIAFFPQLVAGPIERSTRLLPQLKKPFVPSLKESNQGLRLMLLGYFKKVAIADQIAPYVEQIYASPGEASSLRLLAGTLLFAVQIYCDFSGYSDIAIGLAKLFGMDLMINFKRPYFATSLQDFWRRWHVSLSSWFMDYVYIPLGGSRCPPWRYALNILITFLLSGLWHGAAWTFVIWGLIHALVLLAEHVLGKRFPEWRRPSWLGSLQTLLVVSVAWIFFRASSLQLAYHIFLGLFTDWALDLPYLIRSTKGLGLTTWKLLFHGISLLLLYLLERTPFFYAAEEGWPETALSKKLKASASLRFGLYLILSYSILFWSLVSAEQATFIYFQF